MEINRTTMKSFDCNAIKKNSETRQHDTLYSIDKYIVVYLLI